MYCQKCRVPLHLDKSLEDLNPAAFDLLVGSTGKSVPSIPNPSASSRIPSDRKALYEKATSSNPVALHKRTIPPPATPFGGNNPTIQQSQHGFKNPPDMSFVMLTESQVAPPQPPSQDQPNPAQENQNRSGKTNGRVGNGDEESLSYDVERATRLFSILSAHSDIDHPICTECTDMLLVSLQSRLQASTKERDAYIQFLKTLNNSIPTEEEVASAENALQKAKEQEAKAFEDLIALEREKAGLDAEIAALEEESQALDKEEAAFWASRNAFTERILDIQTSRDALDAKYAHDTLQLERLSRTNVYNDTFCIGHDGFFGTINGLRLGRLPTQNVEWSEINAAWGQTLLLLATIAEKLGFTFQGYRLKPMGSTSHIEKLEYPQQSPEESRQQAGSGGRLPPNVAVGSPKVTSLDLFSSGDVPLGRLIHHRRFDAGMVAFLECLAQLGTAVDRLPYPIKGDKIGDPPLSIKLGAGFSGPSDENWTKACKYALTCCKYLLAHTSNVAGDRQVG